MKRCAIWLLILSMIFSGCAAVQDDPFRVDTVVRIPVDLTDAPTEAPSEQPTETPTNAPTEQPTETEAPKKPSSSKDGSGKSPSSKTEQPKETEPPATAAPTEASPEPAYDPSSYSVGSLEYGILALMNEHRAEAEENDLSISGKLSGIAYLRAKEAAASWSHTRPDGRDYTSALSDYGYGYGTVTELMVSTSGSGSADFAISRWMESESGSSKILSSSFSTVGIGVYRAGGAAYIVCLLVG